MESMDIVAQNVENIGNLFPDCITEARDENGKIQKVVDRDRLMQKFSHKIIGGGTTERYEFTWVGKNASRVEANTTTNKTLRPCIEESKDWDNTENLYIEGDNLEVLKLLQNSYFNKVKMIYIDPPYNTGNDFIYIDDFAQNIDEYEEAKGSFDEEGNRLFKNTDTNGRFHSDWCSMIYPRLILARNLLADDGLLFISIGEEELDNLRKILNEIFGENNFRNQIIVRRGSKSLQAQFDTWNKLGQGLEYILLYSKNCAYRFKKQMKVLENPEKSKWNNHWRGTDRPTMRYPLFGYTPDKGQWRWSKERSLKAIENYQKMLNETQNTEETITQDIIDRWYSKQNEKIDLLRKSSTGKAEHYIPRTDKILLNNLWTDLLVGSSSEIEKLFQFKIFDTAKLTSILKRIIQFSSKDCIVLDFFSGSATTAHAVMQLNAEDGGKRKFIMVQLPEETDEKSEAFKAGYENICEIGKERIRRAGEKIKEEAGLNGQDLDIGFRVLKLDSSNMKDIYYSADEYDQGMLENMQSNTKEDRTDLDLLFGCLVDWGLELDKPYTTKEINGHKVHIYNDGDLVACFEKDLDMKTIDEIAKLQALKVVFSDNSFVDSATKINVAEHFKMIAPDTDIKVI